MYTLGIAGLANVEGFLRDEFPNQMAGESRIVQGMDAAAALLHDGTVIAAASQERFDRQKKSGDFPFMAIDYCLQEAQIDFGDMTEVCGNFAFDRYRTVFTDPLATKYYQTCLDPVAIQYLLTEHYGQRRPYVPVDHHLAHLHATLASSEFDHCLGVVMDAAGEIGSTSVYLVEGSRIKRLHRFSIRQSLGIFYSLITQFLGFAFNEDEYKVMGLASLGNPRRFAEFFETAIHLDEDAIKIPLLESSRGFVDGLFFNSAMQGIRQAIDLDGPNCSLEDKADLSAALQQRFTQALFHICDYFQKQTGAQNFLMSGGCAENCSAIGALRDSDMFTRIHVGYASGDEGTALGAAAARTFVRHPLRLAGVMPFFGPAPEHSVANDLATAQGLVVDRFISDVHMIRAAASDIAADRIVGLCHGRMEYGARALGNRSLLALPSQGANKDRINLAIKKRQNFRPFAPAVTAEDAHIYFELRSEERYPYMTMLTRVREDYIDRLPAITHVDGTARVQTVDIEHNPAFYHLLVHLKRLTGAPVVLNTSYNVNHQPIVCSEAEAIDTFLEMGIDALYMAGMRISRS